MVNVEEKVNALTRIADLIGKQTLVMWCIVTTFTTGYLYIDTNKLQESRINEIKQSNERLVEEIKGIKQLQKETKKQVDSAIPKLDYTLDNAEQLIKDMKKRN